MNTSHATGDSDLSVWVVEDNGGYRETIVNLLNGTEGYACTGAFYDYEEVEALLEGLPNWMPPDIVLMDINLPGCDGISGLAHLKSHLPRVRVVMLTVNDAPDLIFSAFRSGACGYLLKASSVAYILEAIRHAHDGGMLMPPAVAAKVMDYFAHTAPYADYSLTKREKEVLALMAEGLAHKQIAGQLFLSPFTVENHLCSIYQKLHVNSGVQAVAKAYREGLL